MIFTFECEGLPDHLWSASLSDYLRKRMWINTYRRRHFLQWNEWNFEKLCHLKSHRRILEWDISGLRIWSGNFTAAVTNDWMLRHYIGPTENYLAYRKSNISIILRTRIFSHVKNLLFQNLTSATSAANPWVVTTEDEIWTPFFDLASVELILWSLNYVLKYLKNSISLTRTINSISVTEQKIYLFREN